MDNWKQTFARKMEQFREQSVAGFNRFADEVLENLFKTVSEFVDQWNFQTSTLRPNEGQRSFKFALTEEDYVLIHFRLKGIDALEYEYEYCMSGKGNIAGQRNSTRLQNANQLWAESCFQIALDDFIDKFSSDEVCQETLVTSEV